MLPEDELKCESWKLVGGGISLRLTHLPTGRHVDDLGPSAVPYFKRLKLMHEQLEADVRGAGNRR